MPTLPEAPLLVGLLLAWSLAAPPGPANALIAQEAARRGWRAGWLTGLGAITGDFVMFSVMGLGVIALFRRAPWVEPVMGVVGAALLAWFAWGAWRSARAGLEGDAGGRGSYWRSFVAVVTSPLNWGWWIGAGATMFSSLGAWVFVGFFAGLLSWVAFWSALARAGAARFRRFAEGVAYASAGVLAVFAAYMLWFSFTRASALLG